MRTLVFGDIHGGYRALQQVLERVSPTTEDTLIFLGDYVDGWSESAEVIECLLELEQRYNCVFVRGNHDTWCEQWLQNELLHEKSWLRYGGQATVESYAKLEDRSRHIAFFSRLQDYYVDAQNRLFIHAGYTAETGPQDEKDRTNLSFDRSLWEFAYGMDKNVKNNPAIKPRKLRVFHEIFIGHTPTLNYNNADVPLNGINVWNIDTGAAFYGKLTAMDADTKEFWQSDQVKLLYPDEKGRNK